MADLTLIIGNKCYSSWSLRGWLALARTVADFDEIVIPLDRPETAAALAKHSPSGRVPCLISPHGRIWDSLAIIEYLAEQFPAAGLWPEDTAARALARAVSAEMHSGFAALRAHLAMDLRSDRAAEGSGPGVDGDIARIVALWSECRQRFGGDGPFLFGSFCAADAMYAPVVTRFKTYAVLLPDDASAYVNAVWECPEMRLWRAAAAEEPWVIDNLNP